jgi:hypothetical protein
MPQPDPSLKTDIGRVALALLIAPLSPGAAICASLTLWAVLADGSRFGDIIGGAVVSFIFGLWFSVLLGYPVALLFGLHVHRLLIAYRYCRCSTYAIVFALLGIIGWQFILLISHETNYHLLPGVLQRFVSAFEFGAPCGAVAGTTFWLIVRPDHLTQIETTR